MCPRVSRDMPNQYTSHEYTIRDAEFVVEATHFEMLCLWGDNERNWWVTWDSVSSGHMPTIGHLTMNQMRMPVVVSVFFAILDGHVVAFYEPTSQVVDHCLVKAWLLRESPAYAAGQECDATNFHQCIRKVASNKVQVVPAPA